mmetsp:Transcript_48223/g.80174  ORF Transcript_48223/g.80174 Transcript_48223/m.80174 type:complete len:290 (-) Transcript_48223:750-1619(-)
MRMGMGVGRRRGRREGRRRMRSRMMVLMKRRRGGSSSSGGEQGLFLDRGDPLVEDVFEGVGHEADIMLRRVEGAGIDKDLSHVLLELLDGRVRRGLEVLLDGAKVHGPSDDARVLGDGEFLPVHRLVERPCEFVHHDRSHDFSTTLEELAVFLVRKTTRPWGEFLLALRTGRRGGQGLSLDADVEVVASIVVISHEVLLVLLGRFRGLWGLWSLWDLGRFGGLGSLWGLWGLDLLGGAQRGCLADRRVLGCQGSEVLGLDIVQRDVGSGSIERTFRKKTQLRINGGPGR